MRLVVFKYPRDSEPISPQTLSDRINREDYLVVNVPEYCDDSRSPGRVNFAETKLGELQLRMAQDVLGPGDIHRAISEIRQVLTTKDSNILEEKLNG